MKRAYHKDYLSGAMRNLAVMMDCGVNKYGFEIDSFYEMFLRSGIAVQFAHGNPRYVAGHSGAELADMVVEQSGGVVSDKNDGTFDVGPDFWTGWVLAYYQWHSNRSFRHLSRRGLTARIVKAMYYPLHEADISKFVDAASELTHS